MLAFALGTLRLAPDAAWRLTPREVALAAAALVGPEPMPPSMAAIAALRARYPDR